MIKMNTKSIKSHFRTKVVKKIVLEDDILKIEYRNKNGGRDDLIFTSPRYLDLFDIEVFLSNVVTGYGSKRLDRELLNHFGKSVCKQLSRIADSNYLGFGEISRIEWGICVLEKAFVGTLNRNH